MEVYKKACTECGEKKYVDDFPPRKDRCKACNKASRKVSWTRKISKNSVLFPTTFRHSYKTSTNDV